MRLGRHNLTVKKSRPKVILTDGREEIELKEKRNLEVGEVVSAFIYDTSKDRRVATLENHIYRSRSS